MESREIFEAPGVFAIFESAFGSVERDFSPRLEFCVWPDGEIVWSQSQRGEVVYYQATIDKSKYEACLSSLNARGILDGDSVLDGGVGIESRFKCIVVNQPEKRICLYSMHECAEVDPKLFASSLGIRYIFPRTQFQSMESEPPEYLCFRLRWLELKSEAAKLIPVSGKPIGIRCDPDFQCCSTYELS